MYFVEGHPPITPYLQICILCNENIVTAVQLLTRIRNALGSTLASHSNSTNLGATSYILESRYENLYTIPHKHWITSFHLHPTCILICYKMLV
jgi:hypothetical protein